MDRRSLLLVALLTGCGSGPRDLGRTAASPADGELPIYYNPQELAATRAVFAKYGDLYIGPGSGAVQLPTRPWAGYWYPLAATDLYGTPDAPLAKLDRLAAALGAPGGIVQWEEDNHAHGVPAADWEGYCTAWAVAAVTTPEPLTPLTYKGITFSPGDLKAIATKLHELYPTTQYGIRYDGTAETDGTYQDLRPEAFHQLVAAVIGAAQQPLVFDTDPGVEVWSKPLYRLSWTIKPDPEVPNAYQVDAYPWFIRNREAPSDAPTTDSDVLADAYTYRLYVDPRTTRGDKALVIAGEWLGASIDDHPDFALVPAVGGALGSANPALEHAVGIVGELLQNGT